jgi:hypothetical protein
MDWIGALFLVLAVAFLVGLYVSQPFFVRQKGLTKAALKIKNETDELGHRRSALLAERDRILTALQDLEFDHALGKVPEEDYPLQRAAYLHEGSEVLKQLDALEPAPAVSLSAEERLEAAVASRRADGRLAQAVSGNGHAVAAAVVARRRPLSNGQDDVETMVSERRKVHTEKAAGFCPRCGKPVQKSDKFCSKCGATI